uniref:Pyroglutamyl-peptidase 1-like n=1 Tax=Salvator merianae TaxID=96440 RepID=A0A8D0EBG0_SALMN
SVFCFILKLLSGFGPFRRHLVNSSWEAAKELSKIGLGDDVSLHIMELPVAYGKAKERVCKAWATLQPQLMIHLGLASSSKAIILEQCGKNKFYTEPDVCGFCPEHGCCLPKGPESIESLINMKKVWKNVCLEEIDIIFSRDAGSTNQSLSYGAFKTRKCWQGAMFRLRQC